MNRREEITKLVTILAEAFSRKATPATFAAYELGLEGLELPAIKAAVTRALKTSQYMPAPAELREMSGEHKPEDRAQLAWLAVGDAMRIHGAYRTVTFDDVVINAAVRSVGGWEHLCQIEPKEFEAHTRRDFMRAYSSLCVSGVGEDQAAPLVGIFDRENAVLGYGPQKVNLITTGLPPLPNAPRIATSRQAIAVPILKLKSSNDAGKESA